jgi:hypothetical protein
MSLTVAYPPNIQPIDPTGDSERKINIEIGELGSGESKDISFQFIATANYISDSIALDLKLSEKYGEYGFEKTIGTQLNARSGSTLSLKVTRNASVQILNPVNLVSDVDKNIPKTLIKKPNGIAVIIGNRDYTKTKAVDYAINDARIMKEYLISAMGYNEGNILYVENASQADFMRIFGSGTDHKGQLFNMINDSSELFIYYSGHGAPNLSEASSKKTGYFVPVDCDPNYVGLAGYSSSIFHHNISKLDATKVTVILDACFSGAELIEGVSSVGIKPKDFKSFENGIMMTSSTGTQVSSWYDDQKHGLFTYYFLKGIQSQEADQNMDSLITYNELYTYLQQTIPKKARSLRAIDQFPTLIGNDRGQVFVDLSN